MYSPDREKDPDETPVGTPGSTHPLDADLLPHKEYVFRHPRATGDLLVHGADDAPGAAMMLMAVIENMPAFRQLLEDAGFLYGAEGAVQVRGFVIKAEGYVLCLPTARNTADGLSRLTVTIRRSELREQLEKAGVIPLLK
jgi:hypothetical protein